MGVYNAAGTRQTRAGLPVTLYSDPDPLYTLTASVFRRRAYPGAESDAATEGTEYQLIGVAGQRYRTSELDSWFAAADITGVSPSAGVAAAGGTTITLTGIGLDGITAITVGGTAATAVTVVSPSRVTFAAPAKAAGTYTIVATDDSGNITETNAITYV